MQQYQAHPKFLIRTPLLPLDGPLQALLAATDPTEQIALLYQIYQHPAVNDALFLASPVLHEQLKKKAGGKSISPEEEEQLAVSLTRYLLRMSTRCTPFGLFAGCTLGTWAEVTDIRLSTPEYMHRHTRPDMDYLCQLAQNLAEMPGIKEFLRYYPNSSYYASGQHIRFVDYHYRRKMRFHRLAAVESSEYINRILLRAANGAVLEDLANELVGDDIEMEEAIEFLYEAIEGKLLVSELDGNTTGPEMLDRMIAVLSRITHSPLALEKSSQLQSLRNEIGRIDQAPPEDGAGRYKGLIGLLNQLEYNYDIQRLLQVDMFKPATTCTFDSGLLRSIQRGLAVLNRLTMKASTNDLERFKTAFVARYESKAIPLLEVLDVESGIGYKAANLGDINPLIDDIRAMPEQGLPPSSQNRLHSFLMQKLLQASKEQLYEIHLTDPELEWLGEPNWDDLPDSISTLAAVVPNTSEAGAPPTVHIIRAFGPSNKILGRFTHLHPEIHRWVRNIAEIEEALNNNAILAEIVHLPESRLGNILMRTQIRGYEIPYLAHSTVPEEQQVKLQDIIVKVDKNEIILFSKMLGKRIIPTMSNSHNYKAKSLPVYQFLCDLQTQNKRSGLMFSWGNAEAEFSFLPRVTYENLILSRATWQINYLEIKPLLGLKKTDDVLKKVVAWKNHLNMPDRVLVERGDNALYVDFNNYLCVKSFLHEIGKTSSVRIVEFLFEDQQGIVKDENGQTYTNELIAVFTKEKKAEQQVNHPVFEPPVLEIKRSFAVGSDWLYFKLYCGHKTADEVLAQSILPLVQRLAAERLVDQWFFIRYSDPDHHIRLRFHLTDPGALGPVIQATHEALQGYMEQKQIWKIQTDTYEREVERYGSYTMPLAEKLFHADSLHTLLFLEQAGELSEETRWMYGLLAADDLLESFGFSLAKKIAFTERMKNSFETEFKVSENVHLRKQLNGKFREHRPKIVSLLNRTGDDVYSDIYALLHARHTDMLPLVQTILSVCREKNLPLDQYISSYLHMHFNRLFTSGQRLYELTLYSLLFNYYQQVLHMTKQQTENKDHVSIPG
ncbi:MAG: lantibiotic dehydratase [Saprospiraceae bacterium]